MPGTRRVWEERYSKPGAPGFAWYDDQPPAELEQVLREVEVPAGAALDVGCGPGSVTRSLAGRFHPAVGLDYAYAAVARARAEGAGAASPATFVAGEAPKLPFRDGAFAFVFDRGCMHNLPATLHRAHMVEVARVLAPGGVFELFFLPEPIRTGKGQPVPSVMSVRGLRRRVRRYMRQRNRESVHEDDLTAKAPASLDVVTLGRAAFASRSTARPIEMIHAVFRKRA